MIQSHLVIDSELNLYMQTDDNIKHVWHLLQLVLSHRQVYTQNKIKVQILHPSSL